MAENLDVDYQMLINFGEYEPFYGPYNAIFWVCNRPLLFVLLY